MSSYAANSIDAENAYALHSSARSIGIILSLAGTYLFPAPPLMYTCALAGGVCQIELFKTVHPNNLMKEKNQ
jgi:hypothetical protein